MTLNIDDIVSDTNLYNAWIKVLENQGCAGIDGVSLADFSSTLWSNLDSLANEVKFNRYRPKPLLAVKTEKNSGGMRTLTIPVIRDRILQTAVAIAITPLFETEFEDISFAYRRRRSVDQAIARIEILRNQGYLWVVDADILSFFDQIDHQLLIQQVENLIKDTDIVKLIRQWLKATVIDDNHRYSMKKGISQGSPISPLLANLYLDKLDELLLDKHYKMIRYADDFVILCKSENQAKRALALTDDILQQLRLCFNQSKTSITHFNRGFRFLGVDFIRTLTFKSVYPADNNIPKKESKQAVVIQSAENSEPEEPALSSMQQAFLKAGINPGQFVPSLTPLPSTPSESSEPEALEVQFDDSSRSSYDPRLKTLYLLKHGLVLGKESERYVIRYKGEIEQEIPAIHVDQIMVFGNIQLTTQCMQFSLLKRIPIFLLSGNGHYYGVVDSFDTESVLLHQQQFLQAANSEFCLKLACSILHGKLSNSRLLLKRFSRHRDRSGLMQASQQLTRIITHIRQSNHLDQLRSRLYVEYSA